MLMHQSISGKLIDSTAVHLLDRHAKPLLKAGEAHAFSDQAQARHHVFGHRGSRINRFAVFDGGRQRENLRIGWLHRQIDIALDRAHNLIAGAVYIAMRPRANSRYGKLRQYCKL